MVREQTLKIKRKEDIVTPLKVDRKNYTAAQRL